MRSQFGLGITMSLNWAAKYSFVAVFGVGTCPDGIALLGLILTGEKEDGFNGGQSVHQISETFAQKWAREKENNTKSGTHLELGHLASVKRMLLFGEFHFGLKTETEIRGLVPKPMDQKILTNFPPNILQHLPIPGSGRHGVTRRVLPFATILFSFLVFSRPFSSFDTTSNDIRDLQTRADSTFEPSSTTEGPDTQFSHFPPRRARWSTVAGPRQRKDLKTIVQTWDRRMGTNKFRLHIIFCSESAF
ncbi:hypothetical protein K438DRAFT_1786681 [Mycena galopus ATCC 62051]|nr:hypothetical protein K438DRAFT_1786681 [Mycena galopus ATCC 62051]